MLSVSPQKDAEGCAVMDTSHNTRTRSNMVFEARELKERKNISCCLS